MHIEYECTLLEIDEDRIVNCDVVSIYKDYYNIDVLKINELKF